MFLTDRDEFDWKDAGHPVCRLAQHRDWQMIESIQTQITTIRSWRARCLERVGLRRSGVMIERQLFCSRIIRRIETRSYMLKPRIVYIVTLTIIDWCIIYQYFQTINQRSLLIFKKDLFLKRNFSKKIFYIYK